MVAALCLAATSCSAAAAHRGGSPTTLRPGAVGTDIWSPPASPTAGPSTEGFCTMLVALYRHMAELPRAADLAVSKEIVADYVAYAPKVVQAAPSTIQGPARTYMTAVSSYLTTESAAGFDNARIPAGSLRVLTEPAVTAAAKALLTYSQRQCHYTIGG